METRCELTVKGTVQKVGFREFSKSLAKAHGLKGMVENLSNYDEDVRIVCEGTHASVAAFIDGLSHAKPPVKVVEVIPEFSSAVGSFSDFTIIRGEDELGERMDYAAQFMQQTVDALNAIKHELVGLRGVAESHRSETAEFRRESAASFGRLAGVAESHRSETVGFREESAASFGQLNLAAETQRAETEGLRIESKTALMGVVSETRGLRNETKSEFGRLDTKYGKISGTLERIARAVER